MASTLRLGTLTLTATLLALCLGSVSAHAGPITLEGMDRILEWTDSENSADDMPDMIWGDSDALLADRVGIHVVFANGLTGSATYSGVSGKWNTANFAGIAADTATGFFANAAGLHFLFNTNATNTYPEALPMAWTDFVMPFSNNFDLDYNDQNHGLSDFRANVGGWDSAVISTYSSTQVGAVPEPGTLSLLGLAAVAGLAIRRRRARA